MAGLQDGIAGWQDGRMAGWKNAPEQLPEVGEAWVLRDIPREVLRVLCQRGQQIGHARALGGWPSRLRQVGRILEHLLALRRGEAFDEPPGTHGGFDPRAMGEATRLKGIVDKELSFTHDETSLGFCFHTLDVRGKALFVDTDC